MKAIGLDIGTTSVGGVILDIAAGDQILTRTMANDTTVRTEPWKHEQNAEKLAGICRQMLIAFKEDYPEICCAGITGQMHGIVYLDRNGNALGNLITWEDERGNLPYIDGISYAEYLQRESGYPMSTGYGLTTHFYNMVNGLVPEGAVKIATIMDYVAMKLCGMKEPCTHPSNAASLGLFDVQACRFDESCLCRLGMDPAILPRLVKEERVIGTTPDGMQILIPVGDNQAGTYAVLSEPGDVLLNIGTSSQITTVCEKYLVRDGLECRPYVGGAYLQLYAGLCGGSSFSLLNQFFRQACALFGQEPPEKLVFQRMMDAAKEARGKDHTLEVETLFRGKRRDPSLRGSIRGIGMDNFTPGDLVLGFYRGVCRELYDAYCYMDLPEGRGRLISGGNALRNNPLLRSICEEMFARSICLIDQKEEAALGAAMLAAGQFDESICSCIA